MLGKRMDLKNNYSQPIGSVQKVDFDRMDDLDRSNTTSATKEQGHFELLRLSKMLERCQKEDEVISESDLEMLAEKYGNLTYFFMHDCIHAMDCQVFGMCSICLVFDRTLLLTNNHLIHYNEHTLGFSVDGGFAFRHLLGHDGRMYHIKEEQIVFDRRNRPTPADLESLKEMVDAREKHIEQMKQQYEEHKKQSERPKSPGAYA